MMHIDFVKALVFLIGVAVFEVLFEFLEFALILGGGNQLERLRELADYEIYLFVVAEFLVSPCLKRHFNGIHRFNFKS